MSRTHDITISAFDLDRLEAELAAVTKERDELKMQIDGNGKAVLLLEKMVYEAREQLAAVTEERDEIKQELENLKASGIHTCHDQCQRPMCVMRRERDALAKALRKLADCDFVITLPDRMDAVRAIAREALEGGKS